MPWHQCEVCIKLGAVAGLMANPIADPASSVRRASPEAFTGAKRLVLQQLGLGQFEIARMPECRSWIGCVSSAQ